MVRHKTDDVRHKTFTDAAEYLCVHISLQLRWPNTVCARFTDSVSDAIKRALGL